MSKRKRETSEEEKALFRETFKDVRPVMPLKNSKSETPKLAGKATPKRHVPGQGPGYSRGLDGRTAERLRKGQLEPQGRLDLHGMTESVAHRALVGFVRQAQARGLRLVLVVTGKGLKPPTEDAPFDLELDSRSRGVLKALAPRWLEEPELAPLVADTRSAHRRHGGSGAIYIYLRKR